MEIVERRQKKKKKKEEHRMRFAIDYNLFVRSSVPPILFPHSMHMHKVDNKLHSWNRFYVFQHLYIPITLRKYAETSCTYL